jgi:pectate lyase
MTHEGFPSTPCILVALVGTSLSITGCGANPPQQPLGPGPAPSRAHSPSTAPSAPAAPGTARLARTPFYGWAAKTPGGRGGALLRVTTLRPTGTGSLAEALATAGPRSIVFEVGGLIDLDRTKLAVREPFVTVAGQTAPSPGITLIRGGISIKTHDVILQHLRVRPGEAGATKGSGWEVDGITTGSGAANVIVDHCSISWATDENLTASGQRFNGGTPAEWRQATSHAITFSHNIVAEGLSQSTHAKGEHSKGTLIHDNVTDVLLVGNLFFSNVDRNPLFKGGARGVAVNNYIANPGSSAMGYNLWPQEWEDHPYQMGQLSIVGNVLTYGPSTEPGVPLLKLDGAGPVEVFLADNLTRDTARRAVPALGGKTELARQLPRPPTWPEGFQPMPASQVGDHVRQSAGARPWDRDGIDQRLVVQALGLGGQIVHSEQEVGGYPVFSEARAAFDAAVWDLESMTPKR